MKYTEWVNSFIDTERRLVVARVGGGGEWGVTA